MLSTFGLCKHLVVVRWVGTGWFALLGAGLERDTACAWEFLVLVTNQTPPFIPTRSCGNARPSQAITFTESGKCVK